MNTSLWLLVGAQIFSLAVGIYSYKKAAISASGFAALILISSLYIWMEELAFLCAIFAMFASSTLLTKYKKFKKKEVNKIGAKEGPRDFVQALANLGIATGIMLLNYFFPHPAFIAAFIGTVAAANADSWASEIGGLSKKKPMLITTFEPVEKGISGGVTMMGSLGGVAGSFFIVAITIGIMLLLGFHGNILLLFIVSLFSGIFGFFMDSYLGAWFQGLYKDEVSLQITENASGQKQLIKGYSWVTNDMINLFATILGAMLAAILFFMAS
ncbi:MAG: DUF92 domain-containing protein [Cytophagaceae bacterium]